MIAPAATAYLLTNRLSRMIWISGIIGIASAVGGYWFRAPSRCFDSRFDGIDDGRFLWIGFSLCSESRHRRHRSTPRSQRWEFAQTMLAIHPIQS